MARRRRRSALGALGAAAGIAAAAASVAAMARGDGGGGAPTSGLREEVVSVKPLIIVIRDFATRTECQGVLDLLDRCRDWTACKEQISQLHKKGNKTVSGRPMRNSTSFTLELEAEVDPAVDGLLRRAHLAARHPITYGEGIQVASYNPGHYYQFHHDALQRRATFLLYLTDLAEGDGGETIFPLLRRPGTPDSEPPPLPPAVILSENFSSSATGNPKIDRMEEMQPYCDSDYYLKVRPEAGKAVIFYGYRPDYGREFHAIHGSCPVKKGHKAIFQRWMRFDANALYDKAEAGDERIRQNRTRLGKELHLAPADPPPEPAEEAPSAAEAAPAAAGEASRSAVPAHELEI